jgi:hypothetical protein
VIESDTHVSIKQILRFPFQGEEWQSRFLIGVGVILAGFVIPLLPTVLIAGYVLRVTRQAVRGESPHLPAWDDWGALALDGLKASLIHLAYLGPGVLVWGGGMTLYFLTSFSFPLLTSLMERTESLFILFPVIMLLNIAVMFLSMTLGGLLLILGAVPVPVAKAHFAAQDDLAAAFRMREWWPRLRDHKLDYLVAWVVVVGLFTLWYIGGLLLSYTIVLCWVMPLLGAPFGIYIALVSAALFGQTYRQSGAAEEIAPQ